MGARIVLFDLGNVLVHWEPARLYRMVMPHDDAQCFVDEICTLAWHTEHDRGVPMDENIAKLSAEHPDKAEFIALWKTRWLDMFHGYIPGAPDIHAELKQRGVPLFALTNMPAEMWPTTSEAFPVIADFEDVIVSGEEKLVKPNPRIFELALNRMGGPRPNEVFFIDDSAKNIHAAADLGFRTHLFDGAPGLRAALEREGLL
ncbi:MAG: HAD family phosphatase [Pseudomonadota bacterium]